MSLNPNKPSVWTNQELLQNLENTGVNIYKKKYTKWDYFISCLFAIGMIILPILIILISVYSAKIGK